MIKIKILLTMILAILILNACTTREIVVPQRGSGGDIVQYPDNTWANETNVKENVDISDLEKDKNIQNEGSLNNNVDSKMERIIFPIDEYSRLQRHGKGTIKGKIFLQNAYEQRILGKTTRLYLNPITSYSKQWYEESYLGGYKMEKADSRLYNYLKFTASDNEGKFAFYGVPTGKYYLIGTVKCGNECGYSMSKSIRIAAQVAISGNQVVIRNLSRLVE